MTEPELPDVPSLRVLAPPPGGLARVRESIARDARPVRWWLVVAPLALAAAAIVLLALGGRDQRLVAPRTATATVADPGMGGSFYWVASQPARPARRAAKVQFVDSVGVAPVMLRP